MTMDLISRKSVAKKMLYRRDYVGRPSDPDCIIADEPSIPAVPLDKLCECLVRKRIGFVDEVDGKRLTATLDKTLWATLIEEWMEGLDAAD